MVARMVGRNFNLQGSWSKLAETFLCGRACRLVAGVGCGAEYVAGFLINLSLSRFHAVLLAETVRKVFYTVTSRRGCRGSRREQRQG